MTKTDAYSVTNIADFETILADLDKEEEAVDQDLSKLFSEKSVIDAEMNHLENIMPNWSSIIANTNKLCKMICFASDLADNVSSKVRQLDLVKSRVDECIRRTHSVLELKACAEEAQLAMQSQNFEAAAMQIRKFLAMQKRLRLFSDAIATTNSDTTSNNHSQSEAAPQLLTQSLSYLQNSHVQLQAILRGQFERISSSAASSSSSNKTVVDDATTLQWFRIALRIGEKRGAVDWLSGLAGAQITQEMRRYYVNESGGVAQPPMAVDLMTQLLELSGKAVQRLQEIITAEDDDDDRNDDDHNDVDEIRQEQESDATPQQQQQKQKVEETEERWITRAICELQRHCDEEAIRLVERFRAETRLEAINSAILAASSNVTQHQRDRDGDAIRGGEESGGFGAGGDGSLLEMGRIEQIICEIVRLNKHAELYFRFLRRKFLSDLPRTQSSSSSSSVSAIQSANQKINDQSATFIDDQTVRFTKFKRECALSRKMHDLIGQYLIFEQFYMRQMVVKAISVEELEEDGRANISKAVDHVFYVVKKSLCRGISSNSVDGVCALLNNATVLLNEHFIERALQKRIRAGGGVAASGWSVQGALQQMSGASASNSAASLRPFPSQQQQQFLVALNDADTSLSCMAMLRAALDEEIRREQLLVLHHNQQQQQSGVGDSSRDRNKLQACLVEFTSSVNDNLKQLQELGFAELCNSVIKPQIKSFLHAFRTQKYFLSEEDLKAYEVSDPWMRQFIDNVSAFLGNFQRALTKNNHEAFVMRAIGEISSQLEEIISTIDFNRFGGRQFDKEIRLLNGFLSVSSMPWGVRDKMARIRQIAALLDVDKVEEVMATWDGVTSRLTPNEIRKTLTRRVDFRPEDIRKIKLI